MKRYVILFLIFGFVFSSIVAQSVITPPTLTTKPTTQTQNKDKKTFTVKGVSFNMIKVYGGSAIVGSESCWGCGKPEHKITLCDYYIGETEVTQALWKAVMGNNPSRFKGSNRPVENVSWYDCQEFILKLNSMTKENFSLPTEAEWEYAARGGNKSKGYEYAGGNRLKNVAWCIDNSGNQTHIVKAKQPNELGLYDMSGNVSEWCNDRCGYWRDKYEKENDQNPQGPTKGYYRRIRGGNWDYYTDFCLVYFRWASHPYYGSDYTGLRLVIDNVKKAKTQTPATTTDFVDLGLPSGTLWKGCNEKKYYYWSDDTLISSKYGNQTPSIFDWQELLNLCTWSWSGGGYKVTGPNGKSIFLPADGYGDNTEGGPDGAGENGYYYSSTYIGRMEKMKYSLDFDSIDKTKGSTGGEFSLRLVRHSKESKFVDYSDMSEDGYVDLGLSSGTLWKNNNEPGYYTHIDAVRKFGGRLPTKKQMQELVDQCVFLWTGNGEVTVYGPNGRAIKLSAEGYIFCHGDGKLDSEISGKGVYCRYWTSTNRDSVNAWYLSISSETYPSVCGAWYQCSKHSVRLVKRKKKLKNMIVPYEK